MLESLRTALLRRSLRHILAAQKRRRHTHTLQTARSIGILFDGTEEKDRREILDFAHSLESPTKKIRLLGFVDVSHPLGQTLFAQFTQKDLGWMGKPRTEAIDTFVHEPLDVLICLNPRQVELVEWVAAASQAAMKIGTYTDLPNDFDLMLETPAEKGPQYFVSQLEIYLKKIVPTNYASAGAI